MGNQAAGMNAVDFILIVGFLVILCFALVLFVGAPYVPTLRPQVLAALREATKDIKHPVLYELGSGDGAVMKAAAKQGIRSVGYELNPIMWVISKVRLWKYRRLATARFGDFWSKPISEADVIFVFLHSRFMKRLDKKITQEARKKVKLISFAFEIPGKQPVVKKDGLYVYEYYPVRAHAHSK
jgi:hypothetical protein